MKTRLPAISDRVIKQVTYDAILLCALRRLGLSGAEATLLCPLSESAHLTDQQLDDALRAAGYDPAEVVVAFRARLPHILRRASRAIDGV